jgi:hypothetical protein
MDINGWGLFKENNFHAPCFVVDAAISVCVFHIADWCVNLSGRLLQGVTGLHKIGTP